MQKEIIQIVSGILLLITLPMLASCCVKKTMAAPTYIVKVPSSFELNGKFEAEVGNKIYFGAGSSNLSLDAKRQIERQADWIIRHPHTAVIVDGHCDERGGADYNLNLGLKRSENTKAYLIKSGVARSRIQVSSSGKLAEQTNKYGPDSWESNRVVTLTIRKIAE